ncbi:uncharacterized protein LOC115631953 [Scaptodrosophila lebanonensis]|uniref:Uncharacterized protein LOC115631953 n=1 Tax=Drosophila lebanonensis TaxID=7225 RepID=A0A6J2U9L9_DROLE|nr:uncharacterized protein LOC115631953 [Scaptodrosophila lebanonensis]
MEQTMDELLYHELINAINNPQPKENHLPLRTQLNPNAVEFVPSYRKSVPCKSDDCKIDVHLRANGKGDANVNCEQIIVETPEPQQPGIDPLTHEMKTEATSTTTLLQFDEPIGDVQRHRDMIYNLQKEVLEMLSQLGGKGQPLTGITVTLAPDERSLNVQFTGHDPNINRQIDALACEEASLHLDFGNMGAIASKPCNVLVAQFLRRMSDIINDRIKWNQDLINAKYTKRNYTEDEIERQIEGIKAFEKFFALNVGSRYTDILGHNAFKELCDKLGIPRTSQCKINYEKDPTECGVRDDINQTHVETDVDPYTADDDSHDESTYGDHSTCEEQSICDIEDEPMQENSQLDSESEDPLPSCSSCTTTSEYANSKVFCFKADDGAQLHVNQLSESDKPQPKTRRRLGVPHPTPAISKTTTGFGACKATNAKIPKQRTPRQTGGGVGARKSNVQKEARTQGLATPRHRGSGAGLPLHMAGARPKSYQRVAVPRAALSGGYQLPSNTSSNASNRSMRSSYRGETRYVTGNKPMSTATTSPANYVNLGKPVKARQTSSGAQKIVPRGTATSIMRQTEVQRRLSLFKGSQPTDVQYGEYLFK